MLRHWYIRLSGLQTHCKEKKKNQTDKREEKVAKSDKVHHKGDGGGNSLLNVKSVLSCETTIQFGYCTLTDSHEPLRLVPGARPLISPVTLTGAPAADCSKWMTPFTGESPTRIATALTMFPAKKPHVPRLCDSLHELHHLPA